MKILLLGSNGQVGWYLQKCLAPLGDLKVCNLGDVNFNNLNNLQKTVRDFCPDIIVNAAAYTDVDKAESEINEAFQVNFNALDLLAREAKLIDAWLIHYSTDYVFDGKKLDPYHEKDKTNPKSIYGKSKLQGENAIIESNCKYLILRTCWLYSIRGRNFLKTILNLAKEKSELRIVNDQIGAPTSAEMVANVTSLCIYKIIQDRALSHDISGVYHLASSGRASWYDFAKHTLYQAQKCGDIFLANPENIIGINSSELLLPAKRPLNSLLNSDKLCKTFNLQLPSWEVTLDKLIKELYFLEA